MTHITLPEDVAFLLSMLDAHGFPAYAVGGCVRDSLMGKIPHDWDICTAASPYETMEVFAGLPVIKTGLKHGTVTVMRHKTGYEITTFRTDGEYSDGRHPDHVTFVKDVAEDLARRDFTINAMAYHPREGLVDLYRGEDDLKDGIIRCVGDPEARFEEDVLRILRAMRFASVFGFDIEPRTAEAIHRNAPRIRQVSMERITAELRRMIVGKAFCTQARRFTDLLTEVIPEIAPCIGFDQKSIWHSYDVWEHSLKAIEAFTALRAGRGSAADESRGSAGKAGQARPNAGIGTVPDAGNSAGPDAGIGTGPDAENSAGPDAGEGMEDTKEAELICTALLFHDIGKPAVCREENGIRHFIHHAPKGAGMTDEILKRLKFDNHTRELVVELILHHDDLWLPSRKGLRHLMSVIGSDQTRRLLVLRRCDIMAQNPQKQAASLADLDILEEYYEKIIREEGCLTISDLAVRGADLIRAGIKPGPEMGHILKRMLELVLNEECPNEKDRLLRAMRELLRPGSDDHKRI